MVLYSNKWSWLYRIVNVLNAVEYTHEIVKVVFLCDFPNKTLLCLHKALLCSDSRNYTTRTQESFLQYDVAGRNNIDVQNNRQY